MQSHTEFSCRQKGLYNHIQNPNGKGLRPTYSFNRSNGKKNNSQFESICSSYQVYNKTDQRSQATKETSNSISLFEGSTASKSIENTPTYITSVLKLHQNKLLHFKFQQNLKWDSAHYTIHLHRKQITLGSLIPKLPIPKIHLKKSLISIEKGEKQSGSLHSSCFCKEFKI